MSLPIIIHCPKCGVQHIDRMESDGTDWSRRLHRTHLCKPQDGGCGNTFKPANFCTVGVAELPPE